MRIAVRNRQWIVFPVLASIVASLLVVVVWSGMQGAGATNRLRAHISFVSYPSVEELSAASELVILGKVEGVVARQADYGGEEALHKADDWAGLPMVFYRVAVTETLQGQATDTIVVSSFDADLLIVDNVTPLRPGQEVLLFLAADRSPGITVVGERYAVLGGDNGGFDVLPGGLVQPRRPSVFRDWQGEHAAEPLTYSLAEVQQRVRGRALVSP